MKLLGNDVLTQEEFDEFYENKYLAHEKSSSEQFLAVENAVKSTNEKLSFLKKVVILEGIAIAALLLINVFKFI